MGLALGARHAVAYRISRQQKILDAGDTLRIVAIAARVKYAHAETPLMGRSLRGG